VGGLNAADSCKREWQLATPRRNASRMIAVPMGDAMLSPPAWHSVIAMDLGTHLYPASFAPARAPDDAALEAQLDALYGRLVRLLLCEALVTRI